ncbi:DegV family protein [Candidatus Formimonas warabiya]|uniref:Fatty acid-binding protein DegV n=1 Tax=Formimonas warabiya TaxID=1761012 RepID=A0A3G1KTE2_FORW1|nr:DegV family protein [Candidatus Formimonas warabiya]ATW25706.1 fatty acid-binding protein DegV [Candidatus Formimonas warabiya]
MKTVIIGDSCSDLPANYIHQHEIPIVHYLYLFQGKEYFDDFGTGMSYQSFYNGLRAGEMPTTSQVNIHTFTEIFTKYVQQGADLVFLSFSSALSSTFTNAVAARKMVLEQYPEREITVIDTKSASLGEGLILHYALEMLHQGASKEEIVDWVENNKLRMNHWFTVEDLEHLRRGGRVSGAAAFVGTVLNIKPILHVDDAGRLIPVMKVRGRKKSIKTLADMAAERIVDPENQIIGISHGDCPEDAFSLQEAIQERIPVKGFLINHVGPVIGAHSGPGTLAVFFLGTQR